MGLSVRPLTEPFAAASPTGAYAAGTDLAEMAAAAGRALPLETTVNVGLAISVIDWLPLAAPPGTYSWTVPDTLTASPTATPFGAESV